MRPQIAVLVSIQLLVTPGFAHGNEQHVMGTVTKVAENSITVETKDHQKVMVSVVAETKFMKGTAAATIKDVKVGDRVVIHAAKREDRLQAQPCVLAAPLRLPNNTLARHDPRYSSPLQERQAKAPQVFGFLCSFSGTPLYLLGRHSFICWALWGSFRTGQPSVFWPL